MPKTATQSTTVICVERELLRAFRAECLRRGTTPTKTLTRLMEQQLNAWLDEWKAELQARD